MQKNMKGIYIRTSIILAIMTLALIAFFVLFNALNGTVEVSGQYTGRLASYSLTCNSDVANYPIFTYSNAQRKETKILILFDDIGKLQRISLFHKLFYNDEKEAEYSRDRNHADQNLSYDDIELNPDSFAAKYSLSNNVFSFSISAESNEINQKTGIYFMLNEKPTEGEYTIEGVKNIYAHQGFNCVEKS